MLALSAGDVRGMWLAVSGYVVAPAALLLLGNAVFSIASGREGIPVCYLIQPIPGGWAASLISALVILMMVGWPLPCRFFRPGSAGLFSYLPALQRPRSSWGLEQAMAGRAVVTPSEGAMNLSDL